MVKKTIKMNYFKILLKRANIFFIAKRLITHKNVGRGMTQNAKSAINNDIRKSYQQQ